MSVAGIAGNLVFFVPPGALLDLCRSRGALSRIRWLSTPGSKALTLLAKPVKIGPINSVGLPECAETYARGVSS